MNLNALQISVLFKDENIKTGGLEAIALNTSDLLLNEEVFRRVINQSTFHLQEQKSQYCQPCQIKKEERKN